jgi:hypothetical protein
MNAIEAIAAALVAAACDRVPVFKTNFDQLTPEGKRIMMLVVCAFIAIGGTIAKCAQNGVCERDSVIETGVTVFGYLIAAFLQIVAINQSIHMVAK